jgi:hypothetical protein
VYRIRLFFAMADLAIQEDELPLANLRRYLPAVIEARWTNFPSAIKSIFLRKLTRKLVFTEMHTSLRASTLARIAMTAMEPSSGARVWNHRPLSQTTPISQVLS